MRRFTFLAGRPGGFMNWPGKSVDSEWSVRAVAIDLFRRWFGHAPSSHWHWHGRMAEASDRRGNYLQVEQWNGYDGWPQDLTRPALALAPDPRSTAGSAVGDGGSPSRTSRKAVHA